MIEEAANRLLASRPRQINAGDFLTEEDINAAILEAARAITVATSSLVRAATMAQRDRIAKQKDPKTKAFYRQDPSWANGLISAAQAVGATTQDLVEASNGFVQKEEGKDDAILISSARQVAAATARLMAASRAKSDPFSETHQSLGNASKEVANATQLLVDAARKAAEWVNQPEDMPLVDENADLNDVAKRKAELEAKAKLLRLQAALERAQNEVASLNEAGYKGGAGGRGAPSGGQRPAAAGRSGAPPQRGGAAGGAPRGGRGGAPPGGVARSPRPQGQ